MATDARTLLVERARKHDFFAEDSAERIRAKECFGSGVGVGQCGNPAWRVDADKEAERGGIAGGDANFVSGFALQSVFRRKGLICFLGLEAHVERAIGGLRYQLLGISLV